MDAVRNNFVCRAGVPVFLGAMLLAAVLMPAGALAVVFPTAGWQRGDVSVGQENSKKAIVAALNSPLPNIEVDVIDFLDEKGRRVGLLAQDVKMDRIAGKEGKFFDYHDVSTLPANTADPDFSPAPFMTVVELFELIKKVRQEKGVTPIVLLEMKEDGNTAKEFGSWLGGLIREYGFEELVFAASLYKETVFGVEAACPQCMTGGIVFNDDWALQHLDYQHTALDLTGLSNLTYFLGFLAKEKFPHDFVLIQDDIFFSQPEVAAYWKDAREVRFVGVFTYKKQRPYSEEEWEKLRQVDWLELGPQQMRQKFNKQDK